MSEVFKFFLLYFMCCVSLLTTPCSADNKIFTTNDVLSIANEVQHTDENSLVVFDVTDVLFEQSNKLFQAQNKNQLKIILKSFINRVSKKEKEDIFSIIIQQSVVPIDTKLVNLINDLQNRGIKVVALTNGLVGKYGRIKSMEDLLLRQLTTLNYHFERSWMNVKNSTLNLSKGKNILFKDGVIFTSVLTSKASKGDSLLAFFKYANINPKKVIFIDDKRKNLKSVLNSLKKNNIEFVGIEYTAARDKHLNFVSLKHAKSQMSILEKDHKLLSDKEIEKMLATNN